MMKRNYWSSKEKKMTKEKKTETKGKGKKMADKKKLHVMSVSKSLPDELNQLQLSDDDVQCPKSNLLPMD